MYSSPVTQSGSVRYVTLVPNQELFGLGGSSTVTFEDLKPWIPIVLSLGGVGVLLATAKQANGEKRYSVPKWAGITGTMAILGSLGYSVYLIYRS